MREKVIMILVLIICSIKGFTQDLRIIRSNAKAISYANGDERFNGNWTISPELRPDIYLAPIKGSSSLVKFITDIDSISFNVKVGEEYDFIILLNDKDSAYTRIKGKKYIPKAVFSDQYKASHNNRTFVEVPEVYDLLNIAYAISNTGQKDPYIVYKKSDYYKEVMEKFGSFIEHPFVKIADSLLKRGMYTALKMDAYAFEFNNGDRIVKTKVYNSISGDDNTLEPFIKELDNFAAAIKFRDFFKQHSAVYYGQVRFYRDTLNTSEMREWLKKNFPNTNYNSFKIIFSPLVAYNQSAEWFDFNGFKEMQAHVNFPYPQEFTSWSSDAAKVIRGNIVFTEINHSFINPEADNPVYMPIINKTFTDLSKWEQKGKPAEGYNNPYSCFNEYMNWVLVSLRYVDYAPKEDMERMIEANGKNMKERRGFTRFPEFNRFVVDLYKNRKQGQTIADLYPQILDWCTKQ